MSGGVVTVEPVEHRTQLRRFRDVPYVLHHEDARWRPGVRAFEQWRLDARRHPYFERGDGAFFLARRGGHPVGRIAAHHGGRDDPAGWFGFFDAPDDDEVVEALLGAASAWLEEEGRPSMTGPVSWAPGEEFGVMVEGHEHQAVTGRPWHPEWYAAALRRAGMTPGARRESHRLSTEVTGPAPAPLEGEPPPHAGGYGDASLLLDGIAAVPDVSGTLADASLRSAWRVARRARSEGFETAVCVRCDGDPAELVPGLLRAARDAGYRWLLAPWAPSGAPPETVHQVFSSGQGAARPAAD